MKESKIKLIYMQYEILEWVLEQRKVIRGYLNTHTHTHSHTATKWKGLPVRQFFCILPVSSHFLMSTAWPLSFAIADLNFHFSLLSVSLPPASPQLQATLHRAGCKVQSTGHACPVTYGCSPSSSVGNPKLSVIYRPKQPPYIQSYRLSPLSLRGVII